MPALLRPMAPTAPTAILCGDPARALAIAQRVLDEPRMSNHHRGLWGYHGTTPAGEELSVQATGIGGPGAALVLSELADGGLRAAIRVGTARGGLAGPPLGSIAAANAVIARDGASVAWGARAGESLEPDPVLREALEAGTDVRVCVHSADRFPDAAGEPARGGGEGAVPTVFDMQSAGLLAAGRELGVRLGVGLVISRDPDRPLEDDPLEAAVLRLAALAADSLAA